MKQSPNQKNNTLLTAPNALVALNIFIFLMFVLLDSRENLLAWGACYLPRIENGEYWRLFTGIFIHGGVVHLIANMVALQRFGTVATEILGPKKMVLTYILAGLWGNTLALWLDPLHVLVGSSGGICGLLGIILLTIIKNPGRAQYVKREQTWLLLAMILLLMPFNEYVNYFSYVGGGSIGLILYFFSFAHTPAYSQPKFSENDRLVVGVLLVAFFMATSSLPTVPDYNRLTADERSLSKRTEEALEKNELGSINAESLQTDFIEPWLKLQVSLEKMRPAAKLWLDQNGQKNFEKLVDLANFSVSSLEIERDLAKESAKFKALDQKLKEGQVSKEEFMTAMLDSVLPETQRVIVNIKSQPTEAKVSLAKAQRANQDFLRRYSQVVVETSAQRLISNSNKFLLFFNPQAPDEKSLASALSFAMNTMPEDCKIIKIRQATLAQFSNDDASYPSKLAEACEQNITIAKALVFDTQAVLRFDLIYKQWNNKSATSIQVIGYAQKMIWPVLAQIQSKAPQERILASLDESSDVGGIDKLHSARQGALDLFLLGMQTDERKTIARAAIIWQNLNGTLAKNLLAAVTKSGEAIGGIF